MDITAVSTFQSDILTMIQRFQIPYAESATNAAINPTASLQATAVANRLCGRRLNFNAIADASITICSKFFNSIHICAQYCIIAL